jgi:hypothetical protein
MQLAYFSSAVTVTRYSGDFAGLAPPKKASKPTNNRDETNAICIFSPNGNPEELTVKCYLFLRAIQWSPGGNIDLEGKDTPFINPFFPSSIGHLYTYKGEFMNDKKLTPMESFWYYLQCLMLGAGYLAKIPVKKALSERGLVTLTAAENIWYVILCLSFGLGYFQKVISKKALSEVKA